MYITYGYEQNIGNATVATERYNNQHLAQNQMIGRVNQQLCETEQFAITCNGRRRNQLTRTGSDFTVCRIIKKFQHTNLTVWHFALKCRILNEERLYSFSVVDELVNTFDSEIYAGQGSTHLRCSATPIPYRAECQMHMCIFIYLKQIHVTFEKLPCQLMTSWAYQRRLRAITSSLYTVTSITRAITRASILFYVRLSSFAIIYLPSKFEGSIHMNIY